MSTSATPGLDLERVADYLRSAVPATAGRPLRAALLPGGKSNLTYRITDGGSSWVVRRPPLGHVLPTAHDMAREFRLMSALRGSPVPVPQTFALCEDESVTGAPFYVMEFVDGVTYRNRSDLERVGAERAGAVCEAMVEVLVRLHSVDPARVGLSGLGRPRGFLDRQVRRWKRQFDASASRRIQGVSELHRRLSANVPKNPDSSIIHGDFRLDNLLMRTDDLVGAVVDWEMSTLGDPLTDLALLVAYQRLASLGSAAVPDHSNAPGYPREEHIIERYAALSGRGVEDLGFYIGLASFKLAAILEGIHYRYTQGETVGEGFDSAGEPVEQLVAAGLESLTGKW